jgi:hypothetical protein
MKNVNQKVREALELQSLEDIFNINQMEYRKRLTQYFLRVKVSEFNSDVLHDINGLKYNNEHFSTRL